jgi:hypothetical protein
MLVENGAREICGNVASLVIRVSDHEQDVRLVSFIVGGSGRSQVPIGRRGVEGKTGNSQNRQSSDNR